MRTIFDQPLGQWPLKASSSGFPNNEIVVCIESFASGDVDYGACARGARLRGGHPIVTKRPQFFASADLPDDELQRLRVELSGAEFIR